MSIRKNYLKVTGVIFAFGCLFIIFYILENPYALIMGRVITVYSEYNLLEQLSKYYLFVIMLISIISYKIERQPDRIKLSIGFFLIGLAMYLSESNMITSQAQPVFGIVILGYVYYLLFMSRSWLTMLLLFLGMAIILLGWVTDYIGEHAWVYDYLPGYVLNTISEKVREEGCDAAGQAFVCLSVIIFFLDNITAFFKMNGFRRVFLVMVTSGMITVGDGFLHWSYHPNIRIKTVALILTLLGFIGFIFTNRHMLEKNHNLTFINEGQQYIFMFFVFVVLPAIFGSHNTMISLVLWLPAIMFMGRYLYLRHPMTTMNR